MTDLPQETPDDPALDLVAAAIFEHRWPGMLFRQLQPLAQDSWRETARCALRAKEAPREG